MKHISLTQVLTVVGFLFYSVARTADAQTLTFPSSQPNSCTQVANAFSEALKNFKDACAKASKSSVGSSPDSCLAETIKCIENASNESTEMSESNSGATITQAINQLAGAYSPAASGMANMSTAFAKKQPNKFENKVCRKTQITYAELTNKRDSLNKEIRGDLKEVQSDQKNLNKEYDELNRTRSDYETTLARENERDEEAAQRLQEKAKDVEEEAMKKQIEVQKNKSKLIAEYRQTLEQRNNLNLINQRRFFDASVRSCIQKTLKEDPSIKPFSANAQIRLKALCTDQQRISYNSGLQSLNDKLRSLDEQFKQLTLEENNAQVATFNRKIQDEARQVQMQTKGQMKATQARMKQLEFQQQMGRTQMTAQQTNTQNQMAIMQRRTELNQIDAAISNFGNPIEATPNEVSAAYWDLQAKIQGVKATADVVGAVTLTKEEKSELQKWLKIPPAEDPDKTKFAELREKAAQSMECAQITAIQAQANEFNGEKSRLKTFHDSLKKAEEQARGAL